ncbi:DUF4832 domain-containing protein [Mucilaginibacter sp. dw_454]|uniref:DUF4832 domain-containing protein n=1 Tax=Mucilaginibacter sp. dw_454 TaxID=2720079 RepID=UPI001BD404DD|nr:DUF4832 domain-containing protein [Mucilaginibacter sp. dw_454]
MKAPAMLLVNLVFMLLITACQKSDLRPVPQTLGSTIQTITSIIAPADTIGSQTVYPAESTELITNPGKGFVQYWGYDATYADNVNTGYIRYDWADIEPGNGVFNWKLIDDQIQQYKAAGKKFSFGIMCANTSRSSDTPDGGQYVTPKWVFNMGAKSRTVTTDFDPANPIVQVIPVWTDAIFLAALDKFILQLGLRYNGNKDIAFVDIRSYGNWGEQHLYGIDGTAVTADQLKYQYLQVYKSAFPNTQLITPWGVDDFDSTYDWAVNNGIGMREDGLLRYSDGKECTRAAGKEPSVFEYASSYDWDVSAGINVSDLLSSDVEIGKPSYIQFDNDMYNANKALYTKIGNRVGYHFVMKSVVIPTSISNYKRFTIQTEVLNKGVTQIYQSCFAAVALIDNAGNVVQKQWLNDLKPSQWLSDTDVKQQSSASFLGIAAGKYKLAIGLFASQTDANPAYKLANTNKIANNWYLLSDKVTIN